ncbi:hypothetical protein [Sphingosinicella sp.]|uniref:hypothetical protein n=1 Tax=Sphingosinicella sp. TaxID=1917971 RepID=UPI004038201F
MPKRARSRAPAPAGTCLRASGKDGPQLIRSAGARWTDEAEGVFLDRLAASCNVSYAAACAGFSTVTAYRRRRRDPGFAERWQAALAQGYARLEAGLLRAACATFAADERPDEEGEDALFVPDPEIPFLPMSVAEAIAILKLHRASVDGAPARYPGWRGRPRSLEEVHASILTKLHAIEAQRRGEGPPE